MVENIFKFSYAASIFVHNLYNIFLSMSPATDIEVYVWGNVHTASCGVTFYCTTSVFSLQRLAMEDDNNSNNAVRG